MDFHTTLQQIQEASKTALDYLSQGGQAEKIGTITAISVATYFVGNVSKKKQLNKCMMNLHIP